MTTDRSAARRRQTASPIPVTHSGACARTATPASVDFAAVPALLMRALERGFETLWLWQTRAEQRMRLLTLDDHELRDIGVTRAEAEAEARKPFWR